MGDLAIGGVMIVALIMGLVEFSKKFGLSGNWLVGLTLVLSILIGGVALAIDQGLIAGPAVTWIGLVVGAVAFGLGVCGLYDLGNKFSENGGNTLVVMPSNVEEGPLQVVNLDKLDAPDEADEADEARATATDADEQGALLTEASGLEPLEL